MLYLFYGEDDYTVRARALAAAARHADEASFGVQRFDGAAAPWGEIVAACNVLPFLSPHQVVRVGGLLGASARRRAASGDDNAKPGASPDAVAGLARSMPETTVLILEEGALQGGNAHLKALSALDVPKEIAHCALPEGPARVRWARDEVVRRGGAIDPAAAALLAERLPTSLWPLSQAIDTLLAYAGPGAPITRAAVEEMVTPEVDENAFHLGDAIVARDPARALAVLHGLMAGGMVEEQALAMLVGRVRDWALAAALKAERVPEDAAMGRLGWNPGKFRAASRGAAAFARGELPRAYQALVIADEALKSRPGDERALIFDMLVLTLATRGDPETLRGMFPVPPV